MNIMQNPSSLVAALIIITAGFMSSAFSRDKGSLAIELMSQGKCELEVVYSNLYETDIHIAYWDVGVGSELYKSLFIVSNGSELVDYVGKLVKRRKPEGTDLILLKSGEKLVAKIDLKKSYRITSNDKNIKVKFENFMPLYYAGTEGVEIVKFEEFTSNEVLIESCTSYKDAHPKKKT
ncbi:hypothetical protein [Pseudoalteromonas rubra]|nr:hypothetical protein [Pseudoalteromonas rubra]